eukprot:Clim_evm1s102 gene=Clim_evmTU1s102
MKGAYSIIALAIVSSVSATDYCTDPWDKCDGDKDTCCKGYCGKANSTDKETKCIPQVPEGDICSDPTGEYQMWICADHMQCPWSDGQVARCQVTPPGKIYCGFDSRADPGEQLYYNRYCDDTQYCAPNASTLFPQCYDYIAKGDQCTLPGFAYGWIGRCEGDMICKFLTPDNSNPAVCVDQDQCVPHWEKGCYGMDEACCGDDYYCDYASVGDTETSCIRYVPLGDICQVPTGLSKYGIVYQTWQCESGTSCEHTQGVFRCMAPN